MTIAELRALEAKATPATWVAFDKDPDADDSRAHGMEFHRPDGDITREFIIEWRPNAKLVVAMRNSYNALLDVAEAATDVDRALKRHDDGDFGLEYEFELDNAWERLRGALATLAA